jgi:hypothetical protein
MAVDFPSSYPVKPESTASKPVDMKSLQETFAAILRSYGTERGGSPMNTLLEISPMHNADNGDNNQQRRENQQHVERNDFTKIDRKLLDKSEIRSSEMNSDYQSRSDRQEILRNDYKEKIERSDLPLSSTRMDASPSGAFPIESLPNENHLPQQNNALGIVSTNSQPLSVSTVPVMNSVTPNGIVGGQTNTVLPTGMNAPISTPTPVTPQTAPPQAFTIFTPSGRWGQSQEKVDEEENDEEKPDEKKVSKKKQSPFAFFEAIRSETARPIQQNHARQQKEPIAKAEQRIVESLQKELEEKPQEIEPEQTRSVKTVEDLLRTAEQNISIQKKGESNQPDQSRYLHRIAAACEAAAIYAPIRMKINLDHLGTLALRFFYKADKLSLRFETPTGEAARFLRDHLEGLKTILSKRNVKIVDIEITGV